MLRRADAGGGEVERPGFSFADQVADGVELGIRIDHDDRGRFRNAADIGEILQRIVRQAREDARIDSDDRALHDQSVAIRVRLRDHAAADIAAGAGTIVDDDRLPETRGQFVLDEPHQNVGAAAGRKWHDHAHRLRREALRVGLTGRKGQHRGGGRKQARHCRHCIPPAFARACSAAFEPSQIE